MDKKRERKRKERNNGTDETKQKERDEEIEEIKEEERKRLAGTITSPLTL